VLPHKIEIVLWPQITVTSLHPICIKNIRMWICESYSELAFINNTRCMFTRWTCLPNPFRHRVSWSSEIRLTWNNFQLTFQLSWNYFLAHNFLTHFCWHLLYCIVVTYLSCSPASYDWIIKLCAACYQKTSLPFYYRMSLFVFFIVLFFQVICL